MLKNYVIKHIKLFGKFEKTALYLLQIIKIIALC